MQTRCQHVAVAEGGRQGMPPPPPPQKKRTGELGWCSPSPSLVWSVGFDPGQSFQDTG